MYYAQLLKGGKIRRIRVLSVVNSHSMPEVCFQVINNTRNDFQSYNFFSLKEIGIGISHKEAELNYGKIVDSKLPPVYNSDEEIVSFLIKIEKGPTKFEYYNYRNVIALD